jgi:hypothetical protein
MLWPIQSRQTTECPLWRSHRWSLPSRCSQAKAESIVHDISVTPVLCGGSIIPETWSQGGLCKAMEASQTNEDEETPAKEGQAKCYKQTQTWRSERQIFGLLGYRVQGVCTLREEEAKSQLERGKLELQQRLAVTSNN